MFRVYEVVGFWVIHDVFRDAYWEASIFAALGFLYIARAKPVGLNGILLYVHLGIAFSASN